MTCAALLSRRRYTLCIYCIVNNEIVAKMVIICFLLYGDSITMVKRCVHFLHTITQYYVFVGCFLSKSSSLPNTFSSQIRRNTFRNVNTYIGIMYIHIFSLERRCGSVGINLESVFYCVSAVVLHTHYIVLWEIYVFVLFTCCFTHYHYYNISDNCSDDTWYRQAPSHQENNHKWKMSYE